MNLFISFWRYILSFCPAPLAPTKWKTQLRASQQRLLVFHPWCLSAEVPLSKTTNCFVNAALAQYYHVLLVDSLRLPLCQDDECQGSYVAGVTGSVWRHVCGTITTNVNWIMCSTSPVLVQKVLQYTEWSIPCYLLNILQSLLEKKTARKALGS